MMKIPKNTLTIISIFTFTLIVGFMAYVGWLFFEPFKPPTLGTGDIPILNKDKMIRGGEPISTKIDYCIYKKVPSSTTRRFENVDNKTVFFLSTTESAGQDPQCGSVESNTGLVPSSIPPGKYRIILVSTFRVNSLKTVTAKYQTEEFWVIR